jgi:hypothetical protein
MTKRWFRLLEACLGIGIGAAIAVPLEIAIVAAPNHQSHAGEIPRVCPPQGHPSGPGLDGDRKAAPGKGMLICDGSTGQWETPEVRAEHVRKRVIDMPWAIP